MQILAQPAHFRKLPGPIVLAAGFFDGVHEGHRQVLASAMERAREVGGQAWVMTFDRHPMAVLAPSKCPPLLSTLEERLYRLERCGVDGVLLLPFTKRLAMQEPAAFVRGLCGRPAGREAAKLVEIRCGANWRFGRLASGTPESLAQYGRHYGFRVVVVPYADYHGVEISSTRIRIAVREGRLDDAAAMLGRPFSVRERVVRGRGVGRSLGFATANLRPQADVLPPNGVYAVRVLVEGVSYAGVANLGVRPTFADSVPDRVVLETHLIGYSGDLYDDWIEVCFVGRLRDEHAFASPDALRQQIACDIRQSERLFETHT